MASIKKRTNKAGEASYLISAFLYEDANGKQVTKSMTWKPPAGMKPTAADKQAEKEAVLFEEKVKNGVITVDGNMKFADYAARWMENAEIKPTTRERLIDCLAHINAAIGHIPLDKLRPEHLQRFYKNLREDGVKHSRCYAALPTLKQRMKDAGIIQKTLADASGITRITMRKAMNGERVSLDVARATAEALSAMGVNTNELVVYDYDSAKFSPLTIRSYHGTIKAILNNAKKMRVISDNVTEYMDAPKAEYPEARYMDDVQAREYLVMLLNEPDIRIRTALIILLFTGLRRAELCGLEWRDIDFVEGKIHVRRTSNYAPKIGIYESTPKTKGSVRSISVKPYLLDILWQYQEWQKERAFDLGDAWMNEKDRLFTTNDGSLIMPSRIQYWAQCFHKKSGFPYINPHALRHTALSLLVASGVDIRTVQSISGHSNAATLLNIYSHAIQSAQDKAIVALNNVLLPPPQAALPAAPGDGIE